MGGNKEKTAIKAGAWYIGAECLSRAIEALMIPIYTHALTKADYGHYNTFLSWIQILSVVLTFNLHSTLVRAKYDHKDDYDTYVSSMIIFEMICLGVFAVTCNSILWWAKGYISYNPWYINGILVYVALHAIFSIFLTRARFFVRYKLCAAVSIVHILLRLLFTVAFLTFFLNDLDAAVWGRILPSIILGLIVTVYLLILGIQSGTVLRVRYWRYALKIAVPYIPHLLSLSILASVDRIMIDRICGSEDAGIYGLAYNCGLVITILLNSMNTAYSPWLADKMYCNELGSIREESKKYALLFVFFSAIVMMIMPDVLFILGGNDYLDSKNVIAPIMMGCVCQFFYTMFVNVEQYEKKTVGMAMGSISAALLNFVLNLWLIPILGYVIAAYTTLISYLFLLLVHMMLVYMIGRSSVYDYRFVIACVASMLALTFTTIWLYQYDVIRRFLLIALIAVTILVIRKTVCFKNPLYYGKIMKDCDPSER